jgi:diacylglycerol kinase (ATP)
MRITLVHNPVAGPPRSPEPGADAVIAELLYAAGHEVHYVATGSEAWRLALQDPGDLVAIAGGDGTAAEVLCSLRGLSVPATIFPVGTANNIAATLGIVGSSAEIVAAWPDYRLRPFDLGVVSGPAAGEERAFVEAIGLGLLTDMIGALDGPAEGLNEAIAHNEGITGYVGLLRAMLQQADAPALRIRLNGQERAGNYVMVEVLNIGRVGPSLQLGQGADPGDGLLEVLLVSDGERDRLETFLAAQQDGRSAASLPTTRVHQLEIEGERLTVRLDDRVSREAGGTVTIKVEAGALRVLAPRERS